MKKTILATLFAGAVVASGYSQGIVNISAGSGKIKYTTDGATLTSVPAGNPDNIAGYGQVNIAIYSAAANTVLSMGTAGVPDFSAWSLSSTILHNIAPGAGSLPTSSVTLSPNTGAAGATEALEVVAWTGNYADFASAAAAGALVGWEGSTLSGGALGWTQATGTSTSPVVLTSGTGGWAGTLVLQPVPEPTTIALGGLGAASLLLFRRKK